MEVIYKDQKPFRVIAAEDEVLADMGVCMECGAEADFAEPDLTNGQCEVCDKFRVFSLTELMIQNKLELIDGQ